MGKVVYADEYLLQYLRTLTCSNPAAIGLIIGQSSKARDYVVHFARTPEERDKPEGEDYVQPLTFHALQEIHESQIDDHVKHVTRMLPGGLCVLGIFICFESNFFSEELLEPKLKKILTNMKKVSGSQHNLYMHNEKLIFHYNPVEQKYTCRVLDVSDPVLGVFKPADWKFQNSNIKWCQISSKFDMNWLCIGGKTSSQLKIQLKNFLQEVNLVLNPAVIVIDGKVQNPQDTLESITKSNNDKKIKSSSDSKYLEATIFTPLQESLMEDNIIVTDCDVELHLMGILRSQVFINQKGTIEEAIFAVKEDILRSLAARMELHWDSLVEEEYGSPEEKQTIHEPPHRVSISLPNSEICLSDYIFPGEGASEVITSFRELLDIHISEENVNVEYEIHGNASDLCGKPVVSPSSTSSDDILSSALPNGFLIAAISFAVILIGIAVALHFQKNASPDKEA